MDKVVSAADANRRFAELLRIVKRGRSVVVTSHGKPVAKITPVVEDERAAEGARSTLYGQTPIIPAHGSGSAASIAMPPGRTAMAPGAVEDN